MKLIGIAIVLSAAILFAYYNSVGTDAPEKFLADSDTYIGDYIQMDYPSTWKHSTFIDAFASSVTFYDLDETLALEMGTWSRFDCSDPDADIYPVPCTDDTDVIPKSQEKEFLHVPNIDQPIEVTVFDTIESETAWPDMMFPNGYTQYVFEVPQRSFERYFHFSNTLTKAEQLAILSTIRLGETGVRN